MTIDNKVKDTKVKDTKVKDTKVKDTKVKDTKVKDTKVKDNKDNIFMDTITKKIRESYPLHVADMKNSKYDTTMPKDNKSFISYYEKFKSEKWNKLTTSQLFHSFYGCKDIKKLQQALDIIRVNVALPVYSERFMFCGISTSDMEKYVRMVQEKNKLSATFKFSKKSLVEKPETATSESESEKPETATSESEKPETATSYIDSETGEEITINNVVKQH